jgi:hypothetical protein
VSYVRAVRPSQHLHAVMSISHASFDVTRDDYRSRGEHLSSDKRLLPFKYMILLYLLCSDNIADPLRTRRRSSASRRRARGDAIGRPRPSLEKRPKGMPGLEIDLHSPSPPLPALCFISRTSPARFFSFTGPGPSASGGSTGVTSGAIGVRGASMGWRLDPVRSPSGAVGPGRLSPRDIDSTLTL